VPGPVRPRAGALGVDGERLASDAFAVGEARELSPATLASHRPAGVDDHELGSRAKSCQGPSFQVPPSGRPSLALKRPRSCTVRVGRARMCAFQTDTRTHANRFTNMEAFLRPPVRT